MLGRVLVVGLGAAVILGGGGVAAMAATSRAGDDSTPTVVDLRKNDDDVELVAEDDTGDDDGDDDARLNDTHLSNGGDTSRPAPAARPRAGDTTGDGDSTAARRPRSVRVTAGQLLINQRISQAALRRLATVEALRAGRPAPRVDDDTDDGRRVRVSAAQLRINQRIAQAAVRRANRLAGRPTPSGGSSGRITLSRRQLLINQRISQAAVRRANALLAAERRR